MPLNTEPEENLNHVLSAKIDNAKNVLQLLKAINFKDVSLIVLKFICYVDNWFFFIVFVWCELTALLTQYLFISFHRWNYVIIAQWCSSERYCLLQQQRPQGDSGGV